MFGSNERDNVQLKERGKRDDGKEKAKEGRKYEEQKRRLDEDGMT